MRVTDYIITPLDLYRGVRALSTWQYVGIAVSVAVYAALSRVIGSGVALLPAGVLIMSIANISYKVPLFLAIAGLLALMAMSPFVHDGNSLDNMSESLAVVVLFTLIVGVYKMIFDEVITAIKGHKPTQAHAQKKQTLQHQRRPAPTAAPVSAAPRPVLAPAPVMQSRSAPIQQQQPTARPPIHPQSQPSLIRMPPRPQQRPLAARRSVPAHRIVKPLPVIPTGHAANILDLSKVRPVQHIRATPTPRPIPVTDHPQPVRRPALRTKRPTSQRIGSSTNGLIQG